MGKAARIRARHAAEALSGPTRARQRPIGPGRPTGPARAATRNWGGRNTAPVASNPWQGYGNAMIVGRSKVWRWKMNRTRAERERMDAYLTQLAENGQIKTIYDVQNVMERDQRESLAKR